MNSETTTVIKTPFGELPVDYGDTTSHRLRFITTNAGFSIYALVHAGYNVPATIILTKEQEDGSERFVMHGTLHEVVAKFPTE